jgi:PmbA protein
MAKAGEAAALAADPRITRSEGAEVQRSVHRVVYASSAGFRGGYAGTSVAHAVVPVAVDNGGMQRDYWFSASRHLAGLEAPEAVGACAAARTLRRLGARKVPTCVVPVVFDPNAAGTLLRHLAGAVSGYAIAKGSSFLVDKVGERIAPAGVTVIDDPCLPRALGSKPFDGEGVRTRRNVVLEDGVLTGYLCDSYSGRKLGLATTGSASRSVGATPGVGPTNFLLQPGEWAPDDIIGSVQSGLYVTELIGFGVNPVTGDYSRGVVGMWIENGALAYPVEEITIAGNLLEMYAGIEAVGTDLDLRRSISAPTLKIGRMMVAGS